MKKDDRKRLFFPQHFPFLFEGLSLLFHFILFYIFAVVCSAVASQRDKGWRRFKTFSVNEIDKPFPRLWSSCFPKGLSNLLTALALYPLYVNHLRCGFGSHPSTPPSVGTDISSALSTCLAVLGVMGLCQNIFGRKQSITSRESTPFLALQGSPRR